VDIFDASGGRYKALALESDGVTAAGGAGLLVELVNQTYNPAVLSGIEILEANAGGVAAATADLELSVDDGATWSAVATSVAMNRFGEGVFLWTAGPETPGNTARFRVTANHGTMPQDMSDAGFLVANGGNAYYVNDGSTEGDEYTTAVGDNAASGKSPDAPMASLVALFNAYW